MQKLIFLLFLFIGHNAVSQEYSLDKKWLLYFELAGNGYNYSLNTEVLTQKSNYVIGDRLGLTIRIDDVFFYNWAALYERNYIFGKKRFRPELGIGTSFLYFPGRTFYVYPSGFFAPYNTNYDYEWEVYLTTRVGVRYVSKRKFNARFGLIPLVHLTRLDEDSFLGGTFGLSFGWMLN